MSLDQFYTSQVLIGGCKQQQQQRKLKKTLHTYTYKIHDTSIKNFEFSFWLFTAHHSCHMDKFSHHKHAIPLNNLLQQRG